MSDIQWLGNRVQLQEIEGTDLTFLQWRRPRHGSLRGHMVIGSQERALVEAAVEDAAAGRREHPRLDAAGYPTDLETFLTDVLGRRGQPRTRSMPRPEADPEARPRGHSASAPDSTVSRIPESSASSRNGAGSTWIHRTTAE